MPSNTALVPRWQVYAGKPIEEREIVIGFDFGTACSKLILQDRLKRVAFAVPFSGCGYEANPYLIPSAFWVASDGSLSLTEGKYRISDFKLQCIDAPDKTIMRIRSKGIEISASQIAIGYLTLVLKGAWFWFSKNKANDYRHTRIAWQLNIGMPSRSCDDKALCSKMKLMALAAWNLTLLNKPRINILDLGRVENLARKQLEEERVERSSGQLHPHYVNTVPEIIAEVIGYAHSQMRHDGMYLLADVGASTLDISAFILSSKDEEDHYTILGSDVKRKGAYRLHQYRVDECRKIINKKFNEVEHRCDGIAPLPDKDQYLPRIIKSDEDTYDKANETFLCECSRSLRSVIRVAQQEKNPNATEWEKGLPYFLCGGGSKTDFYRSIIRHAAERLETTRFAGFIEKSLPQPSNLEGDDIPPEDYHRLAVAYGLSHAFIDIGKIIPPHDDPDFSPEHPTIFPKTPVMNIDEHYVDKDMT